MYASGYCSSWASRCYSAPGRVSPSPSFRLRGSRTASAELAAPGLTRIHAVEACRRPPDSSTLQSRQVKVIAMTFFTSGHLGGSTYNKRDVGAAAHLISCIQG